MDEHEAREALAEVGAAQVRLADAMTCPPWRHALFGAIMGSLVGAAALPKPGFVTAGAMLATVLLMQRDRRQMGVFVDGFRKGQTRVVTLIMLAVMVSLVFVEIHLRFAGASIPAKLAIPVIATAFATVASVVWQRVYVRELTRELR